MFRYRRSLFLSPQQLHGGVFKDVLELFLQNLVELAAAAAAAAAAEAAKEKSFFPKETWVTGIILGTKNGFNVCFLWVNLSR